MGRFLTTIFYLTPQVLYILRNFRQNPVQWRWAPQSWSPSETSRGWRTSSTYGEVPDNYFSLNTLCIIYIWKSQAKSSSMKMTPTIIVNTSQPFPEIHSIFSCPEQLYRWPCWSVCLLVCRFVEIVTIAYLYWPLLTLGWPWDDLGRPWDDLGMTLRWPWDDFRMTLGWLWDDFGMTLG